MYNHKMLGQLLTTPNNKLKLWNSLNFSLSLSSSLFLSVKNCVDCNNVQYKYSILMKK